MLEIVLIEDDPEVLNYLTEVISNSPLYKVAGAFPTAEAAMVFFEQEVHDKVQIVFTDIQLPGKNGIEFIEWLHSKNPEISCVVLSAYDDTDKVFKALKAGAIGYMLKHTTSDGIMEAIADALNGGSPMSSTIARKVVKAFSEDVPYNEAREKLSNREQEVLQLLSKGFAYKEIADQLFLSIETIRTHVRNIYEKLQVKNKREAIKKAGLY